MVNFKENLRLSYDEIKVKLEKLVNGLNAMNTNSYNIISSAQAKNDRIGNT